MIDDARPWDHRPAPPTQPAPSGDPYDSAGPSSPSGQITLAERVRRFAWLSNAERARYGHDPERWWAERGGRE